LVDYRDDDRGHADPGLFVQATLTKTIPYSELAAIRGIVKQWRNL
jgi:hypothetical protein